MNDPYARYQWNIINEGPQNQRRNYNDLMNPEMNIYNPTKKI